MPRFPTFNISHNTLDRWDRFCMGARLLPPPLGLRDHIAKKGTEFSKVSHHLLHKTLAFWRTFIVTTELKCSSDILTIADPHIWRVANFFHTKVRWCKNLTYFLYGNNYRRVKYWSHFAWVLSASASTIIRFGFDFHLLYKIFQKSILIEISGSQGTERKYCSGLSFSVCSFPAVI